MRFDKISRAIYATDASVYQITPTGVVIPRTREDVLRTVRLCREHGVSITARGGGTSQAGQAIGAGIQLDFSKYLNALLDLNLDERTVKVEPGIVLDELNDKLKPHGLQLPLDLSTSNRATIGGMIANNSSGTRSVIYGATIDYVIDLNVLLSDGSIINLRPLDESALAAKCDQDNLEGACYRTVRNLAIEHAEEIALRYPKITRRTGGYNLNKFVPSDQPFNLTRLLVGSEGTLGITLDATLRLVPIPKARVLCVVQFDEMLDSLSATPFILKHQPSAVELMDRFLLDCTKGKPEFEPLRDFIVGDPGAILIVEFSGDSPGDLPHCIDHLETDLRDRGLAPHLHRAIEPAAQARIWKLRKAGLGLAMSQIGDAKSVSYIEDTAVAPERLRDYIEQFKAILAEHSTEAGFYAHASVGLIHVRPVVNMKTADGIDKFVRVAEKISDLVLKFGGALSSEHGDGLVRAPFQEKMFGSTLYRAFCEVKQTFDPDGLFNPGKIVHAPPLTQNLRFGPSYQTRKVDTAFSFSDFGGLSMAAEQCGGIGECRKTLTGSMCPSYMATRDENDTTRARANALRLAISGQLGPDGLADKSLYPVLDLCLECKACKTECPTGVDMARMKSEFLYQYYQHHRPSARTRLLAGAERIAVWGSRFAPLSNYITRNSLTRWFNEKLFNLDSRRIPPTFARRTFLHWWSRHCENNNGNSQSDPEAALFADTFTNYHEPIHAIAAVRVAESLGVRLTVPQRVCCGRPLISKGFLKEAAKQAAATTHTLAPLARRGLPIIFCEPSCYSAVRDDHPHLLRDELREQSEMVASACLTFEEWADTKVADLIDARNGDDEPLFRSGPSKILLHGHCHQKALVGMDSAARLLSRIPDCQVTVLDSGCCGMAGSFGYEKEHYNVSQAVGERVLLPAIRDKEPDTVVVAPGFSCRHQVEHFTGIEAHTTMTLLETLLSPSPTNH